MLSHDALNALFFAARTHNAFRPDPIDVALLQKVYDTAKMAPTAANSNPLRVAFVISKEAKEKLVSALDAGNQVKTLQAPVTAIMAYDLQFAEHMPELFPHAPNAKDWFADPSVAEAVAKLNSTLGAGYFLLAARAMGLDCGPMIGFDAAKVDQLFFAGTSWRSSFLINLGHGDPVGVHPRNPRLSFEQACRVL